MTIPTVFISYSHRDEAWKDRLVPQLQALEMAGLDMKVWHDRKIDGGDKWYPEIQAAIDSAAVAVLLISPDFLASPFCVKEEVPALIRRQEQGGMLLIPVLVRACPWKAHRWLRERQMIPRDGKCIAIDFAGDLADGVLAQVAEQVMGHLEPAPAVACEQAPAPAPTPPGVGAFTFTGYAFSLPEDDAAEAPDAAQEAAAEAAPEAPPDAAPEAVPEAPAEAAPQATAETAAEALPGAAPEPAFDLSHLPDTGSSLFGRDKELEILDQAWSPTDSAAPPVRVLAFTAQGGVGKSTLVNHWLAEMRSDGFRGAQRVFGWSFYSQGVRTQTTASSDLFISAALRFFGDADPTAGSAWDKGRRLAHLVGSQRALLVLDGLEPLQSAQAFDRGRLRDPAMESLLRGLARQSAGLCLITTREALPDLTGRPGFHAHDLEQISPEAGRALLRTLRVVGADTELEDLARRFGPHALAISLLGVYLREQPGRGVGPAAALEQLPGDTPLARVLAGFEQWLGPSAELDTLRLLGLFDRPADAGCLAALRKTPVIAGLTDHLTELEPARWQAVAARLENLRLVQLQRDDGGDGFSLDAHPLLREHFAQQLGRGQTGAWQAGHRRLYEHLCDDTRERQRPRLDDLLPLYRAVAHGCQAGLHEEAFKEVYRKRIVQEKKSYSTKQLGTYGIDLGAVACFFETPWSRVWPGFDESERAWLLNGAAFRLRALGLLGEALAPMRMALELRVGAGQWATAAVSAGNLSELGLALGMLLDNPGLSALTEAVAAVEYAERSNDLFQRMSKRATLAEVRHQTGQEAEAARLFREAEALQAQYEPSHPLLYSMRGFRYCDLLLAQAERDAWRACLMPGLHGASRHALALGDVEQRIETVMGWRAPEDSLLLVALEHLTLGRTLLLSALLNTSTGTRPEAWVAPASGARITGEIQEAVNGLRSAGTRHHLPLSLLARAWLLGLQDRLAGPDSAQADLDEAWEITERGPMLLFQADIHLHRARLFYRQASYPWQSAAHDLAEARRLIFKHGYLRRRQELEDAEAVILHGATSLPPAEC